MTTSARSWRPRRSRAIGAPLLAIGAALLLVTFLVASVTRAAFVDTTNDGGSSLTAGTVDLVDDDLGSVLFNVSGIVPGDIVSNCIVVTYQGTVTDPSPVRLYSGGYTDSGDFASYLNLTVEEGAGGSFDDCTGFAPAATIESGGTLAAFDAAHTGYATGAGTWDPSSTPESTTYRVTFELDPAAPSAEQGESVTDLFFTWEVQS